MIHKDKRYGKRRSCVIPSDSEKAYIRKYGRRIEAKHISAIKGIYIWDAEPKHELYVLSDARYGREKYDSLEHKRIYNASTDRFLKVNRRSKNRPEYAVLRMTLKNGDKINVSIGALVCEVFPELCLSSGNITSNEFRWEIHHKDDAITESGFKCNDWYNLFKVFGEKISDSDKYDEHDAIHAFRRTGVTQRVTLPIPIKAVITIGGEAN